MIYFVEAVGSDRVKIGFTGGAVADRVSQLQTGSPHRLELLFEIAGELPDEQRWHRRFAEYREAGEWFRIEGELRMFLNIAPWLNGLYLRTFAIEDGISRVCDRLTEVESTVDWLSNHQAKLARHRLDSLREEIAITEETYPTPEEE